MLQQEESMLPNSAGVHEGNLRHSKTSKSPSVVYFTLGVELYTQIAVRFSHERLETSREILPASIDGYDNKIEYIVCHWNF